MTSGPVSVMPREEDKSRDKKDAQRLINAVLSSPLSDAPIADVDGRMSMSKLMKMNTTVQARIILQMSAMAMSGDIKAAEFLFKYGGLEPAKEHDVSLKVPVFLDDMSMPISAADEEAIFADKPEPVKLLPYSEDDDDDYE